MNDDFARTVTTLTSKMPNVGTSPSSSSRVMLPKYSLFLRLRRAYDAFITIAACAGKHHLPSVSTGGVSVPP